MLDKKIDRRLGTTAVRLPELEVGRIPGFVRTAELSLYICIFSFLFAIDFEVTYDRPLLERWVNGCGFGTPPENSICGKMWCWNQIMAEWLCGCALSRVMVEAYCVEVACSF